MAAVSGAGNSAFSDVATATTQSGASGAVARPGYNTGVGFFTLNGRLYDANGNQFIPMGVDTLHYDGSWMTCSSNCGIPNSGSNTIRMNTAMSQPASALRNLMDFTIHNKIVPMPEVSAPTTTSAHTTCDTTTATLDAAVSDWVSQYAVYKPYEKHMLLNIANEWGPSNSTVWRDAYISAVNALRAAGYLCTLVIDSGGCGQDPADLENYAAAVYAADPQHNILFSWHIYGGSSVRFTPTSIASSMQAVAAAGAAGGFPIVIGEFGPGNNVGPSPTQVTPLTIMQQAGTLGMGWLAWAWDDGYGRGATWFELSNAGGFSLTNGVPTNGAYPNNTDLSAFGNIVVLDPQYGTFHAARKATVFP
jgi:hypothetical protein